MTTAGRLIYREAEPADAEQIAGVFARSCAHAYRAFFPPELLAQYTPERQRERWTRHLQSLEPGTTFLAAFDGGRPVGFIECGPSVPAPGVPSDAAEVHYLFVDPRDLGQGVGRELLGAAETRLADVGYTTAVLWVFRDNSPARGFYDRAGWSAVGVERLEPNLAAHGYAITECLYQRRPRGPRDNLLADRDDR